MKKAYVSWNENAFPGLLGNVISGRITNRFDLGGTSLALRARGDALFPREGEPGVMLAFRLDSVDEVERWFRRLLMAKVAVLEPPTDQPSGDRTLHAADPEGNVLCLFATR